MALLSSGGKDSLLAALHAVEDGHDLVCLTTIRPERADSWMFHVPNVEWTHLHAKALGIPLIYEVSKGVKEEELADLERALIKAREIYKADGVVSGAIASRYQKERIDALCSKLGMRSYAPLWSRDQLDLLKELLGRGFEVIFVGVFSMGLDSSWLGRRLSFSEVEELKSLSRKFGINPSGEGGEYETFVTDMPLFKKKIRVLSSEIKWCRTWGVLQIKNAILEDKLTNLP